MQAPPASREGPLDDLAASGLMMAAAVVALAAVYVGTGWHDGFGDWDLHRLGRRLRRLAYWVLPAAAVAGPALLTFYRRLLGQPPGGWGVLLAIPRAGFGKDYLFTASLIPQARAATSTGLAAKIVRFELYPDGVDMYESTKGLVVTEDLPARRLSLLSQVRGISLLRSRSASSQFAPNRRGLSSSQEW